MDIGGQLRAARKRRGLKQQHVAKEAGISQTYLSQIELHGVLATQKTLGRVAKAISPDLTIQVKLVEEVK